MWFSVVIGLGRGRDIEQKKKAQTQHMKSQTYNKELEELLQKNLLRKITGVKF